jgi:NAD(P)-dependent dehydrogenase (short-subunit alcohol dehydrogenase family)
MSPSLVTPATATADLALPAVVPESDQTPANTSHAALFSLANKTVAITGGGRGLGITLAGAVLEAGGHVACLDILPAPAAAEWASLQKLARASGLGLSYRRLDVTDEEALAAVFDDIDAEASARGAPFYGCVACAGIQQRLPAIEYPAADFDRIQRVNVTGTVLTAKHTARVLVKNGVRGSLVLIASMSGQIANRVSNQCLLLRFDVS